MKGCNYYYHSFIKYFRITSEITNGQTETSLSTSPWVIRKDTNLDSTYITPQDTNGHAAQEVLGLAEEEDGAEYSQLLCGRYSLLWK